MKYLNVHQYLLITIITVCMGLGTKCGHAQSEADRPAGEVTEHMLKQVPAHWIGAGNAAGAPIDGMRNMHDSTLPLNVIPTPQETYWSDSIYDLGTKDSLSISVETSGSGGKRMAVLEQEFYKKLGIRYGAQKGNGEPGVRFVFALNPSDLPVKGDLMAKRLGSLSDDQGHVIKCVSENGKSYVLVAGNSENALWHGMVTLVQMIEPYGDHLILPEVEIIDYPQMKRRGLLVDMGGQGFMIGPSMWDLERWKEFVDWMVDHKMNEIFFEIIGSGRLMGNLDMMAGEWIGFPVDLKSYPELVGKNRPFRRWDDIEKRVVQDTYTAPNVEKEFLRELIDYGKARGIKCSLIIGYDYFANQLPVVLGVPANDPSHLGANKVYDTLLKEIVTRYSNASGVIFITIENKHVPPEMVDHVIRRVREGKKIVHDINPDMDIGVLNDYLEWRPRNEFLRYADHVADEVFQLYAPHTPPEDKSWKRLYPNIFRYELFSQYAWDHIAYIFPERVKKELQESYINGYRKIISQGWYWDVTTLNYICMSQYAWNSTGPTLDVFWDTVLQREFGSEAKGLMKVALEHTRFDIRFDIVARMIRGDYIDRSFQFWDMYNLTNIDGLKDTMLADLQEDAQKSLDAAKAALPLVHEPFAKEMVEFIITSAERRLYLAISARYMLQAHKFKKAGEKEKALAEINKSLETGMKLEQAASKMGIEYPMAMQDDDVIKIYQDMKEEIESM